MSSQKLSQKSSKSVSSEKQMLLEEMSTLHPNPKFMVITPINKNKKSNSNVDYREQLERVSTGYYIWCWDDSKYNTANIGEYFGFLFYGNKVVIHIIKSIKNKNERLPSWSNNVGQGDRRVLELTYPLFEIDWCTWILIGGCKKCMGTYRTTNLITKHTELYKYLTNKMNELKDENKEI